MGETVEVTLPSKEVVKTLWKKHAEVKEETSALGGEWSGQLGRYVENGNVHRGAFNDASKIVRKGRNNETAGLEYIAHLRTYLDWAEEEIRAKGHVGDIVTLAQQPEKKEEQPAAPAPAAAAAPTPAEALASMKKPRAKKAAAEKAPDSVDAFRADMKATVKKGDDHIRKVAADLDDDLDPPAPPANVHPFPDIPPELDRRSKKRNPLEGATGQGSYKVN